MVMKKSLSGLFSSPTALVHALGHRSPQLSARMVALSLSISKRGYCTSKQEKKQDTKNDSEEVVDVDGKSSPFGRKSESAEQHASSKPQDEYRFVPPGAQNPIPKDGSRVFTPTYIVTINTEKTLFKRLWRGMGLISFNFVIAARSWKTKPDGGEVPAFWEKQLLTARLDALLLMWAITVITGADLMMFIIWMTGAIYFPQQLVPSVLRTPSRGDVRAFIHGHLQDLDPNGTGFAPVADAKRVLMVVERTMSEEVLHAVLTAAGANDQEVDYEKLADVVVGSSTHE